MPALTSYKTPGVYVEEIPKLPPSIAQVETAIPVFIGYTEVSVREGEILENVPTRVTSMDQYVRWFGGEPIEELSVTLKGDDIKNIEDITSIDVPQYHELTFRMYHAAQLFFDNGGGICYVISVGTIDSVQNGVIDQKKLADAVELLNKEDEPTLIVFPDAVNKTPPPNGNGGGNNAAKPPYITPYEKALDFCSSEKINNYFTLMDVAMAKLKTDRPLDDTNPFRDYTPSEINKVKYGAAYYPFLVTSLIPKYNDGSVTITGLPADGNGSNGNGGNGGDATSDNNDDDGGDDSGDNGNENENGGNGTNGNGTSNNANGDSSQKLSDLKDSNNQIYNAIKNAIALRTRLVMPPSSIMSGVYARVDAQSGVFKAPANVGLINVVGPVSKVADIDQDEFNVDSKAGKSINVVRTFKGIGTLVWGARTLAGNDREWKYNSVRRFFNMVEESVKRSLFRFVFEPNNPNTWSSVRASIEAFLETQWRAGAMLGNTPRDAFFVRVGVPETFSTAEMLDGYMVVEIGMAVVRPAEFIILKFMHKFELGQ